jgi:hypothetical protein
VLEIGAGIGDHTSFFLDRGCKVTATDARPENIAIIARRFPDIQTTVFDLDGPVPESLVPHEVVYAYGILYHLRNPLAALGVMASLCSNMLLLETCVSYGEEAVINPVSEDSADVTQSVWGQGCRPTRAWVFQALHGLFPYVYLTRTQPWHPEFPTDWTQQTSNLTGLYRAIFVASGEAITSPWLVRELLKYQERV